MATRKPLAAYLKKDPTGVHEGFAEFIEKQTGHTVPVGDVALVQRLYPLYLKSPAVAKARAAEKAAREKEAREREEAKAARLKARLDKIEAQRRALLDALGIEEEQESKPASVLPFPKPKAVKAAEETEPEATEPEEPETVEVTLSDDEFVETGDGDDDWGDEAASDESDEEDW